MRTLIVLMFAVLALAGCSEDAAPVQDDEFSEFADDLDATEDTGIIRGVVVDEAVVPIAGVTVTVTGQELVGTTDEKGLFGFDNLAPGTYFLDVAKIGYTGVQTSVDVVAGDDAPEIKRIRLISDPSSLPYATPYYHKGYYQCGLAFVVVCGAPNVLTGGEVTDDSSTHTFYFPKGATFIQTEMDWKTSQTVSPDLRLEVETLDDGCTGGTLIGNVLGPSPLKMTANETQIIDHGVGGEECGLYHSVFAGDVLDQQHCFLWGSVPLVKCGVGFSVEQDFEWFLTEFHGFSPDEDYWYIEDGLPTPPS